MPNIKIENLTVNYKNKKKQVINALENFNVVFDNNKVNVLIGESGCGKTTLLKCICKQVKYEGNIYFNDKNIREIDFIKENIGYVDQNILLYPHMTVFENIAFPLTTQKYHNDDIKLLVREIAKTFELAPFLNRKPKELSVGQQQRVAIAKALVKKPKICLFDEPLANIDKQLALKIRMYLKKFLSNNDSTFIYITHEYYEAMSLADKIFVMNDSKIEISGVPLDLINSKNETFNCLRKSSEFIIE